MRLGALAAAAAGYLVGYRHGWVDGKLRGRIVQLSETAAAIAAGARGADRRDDARVRWGAH